MDGAVRDGDHQHPQRHRSNMLMDFPYGKEFVYDEMVLTGPGEKGEANAKSSWPPSTPRDGRPRWAEAGRGTVEGGARERLLRPAVRRDRA